MKILSFFLCLISVQSFSQTTPFEKSGGTESATYFEATEWYKTLDKNFSKILVKQMGPTDAGYPLQLVLVSSDGKFDPEIWHQQNKVVILINNGIHPGEPDGIDASMMLTRDIVKNKLKLPINVVLGIIPVYNIGGSLNRNSYTRANQNGPVAYGFRGNAQNLDLNRDFTKSDSKNASSFAQIFHYLKPDIQIDNHVSDGADFQHTMTLITTQYEKLGDTLGNWVKKTFEPALYNNMENKGWKMIPYVDFAATDFDKGMQMFLDPPRYSSGYAALFNTLSFMPETHMLKPYKERVKSTYDLMNTFIEEASVFSNELLATRRAAVTEWNSKLAFPLRWKIDSSYFNEVTFNGYEVGYAPSYATGLTKMFYDHNKPFTKKIKFYNKYIPSEIVAKPKAYVIPQGWWKVIDHLKENGVKCIQLKQDSSILVSGYKIDNYKSFPGPYEGHHKNYGVSVTKTFMTVTFLKGDFLIFNNTNASRYIIEMLEPTGDDSFFSWNFFDAILQQKEGYSDYRWEEIAAEVLRSDIGIQKKLAEEKEKDFQFAASPKAILAFIYCNSKYFEKAFLQYPVYRIEY